MLNSLLIDSILDIEKRYQKHGPTIRVYALAVRWNVPTIQAEAWLKEYHGRA